jgi:hypothetical protein
MEKSFPDGLMWCWPNSRRSLSCMAAFGIDIAVAKKLLQGLDVSV